MRDNNEEVGRGIGGRDPLNVTKILIIGTGVLIAGLALAALVATRFTLSALPEPGQVETAIATRAKHYLVHRSSREGIPSIPSDPQAATKEGERLFGKECGACHGNSGHNPTDAGRWMYPRAAELSSRESQSYSDQEVFWIIKNGIRLSGMPAFGKVEPDEHIWDLVLYVRALPKDADKGSNRGQFWKALAEASSLCRHVTSWQVKNRSTQWRFLCDRISEELSSEAWLGRWRSP